MKKYLMNKDVDHNGKLYKNGSEIMASDPGFSQIVEKGHAKEFVFKDQGQAEQDQESYQPKQSFGKSKK